MRFRIVLVPAFVALSAPVFGAELSAACKPVFAAMEKTLQADHASTTTIGTDTAKSITVGGNNYLQLGGTWKKSRTTVQDNLERSRENLKNAKEYSCRTLPDSSVGGVSVANYAAHTVGEAVVDSTISIDKRTGLAVTVVTDMKDEHMHIVTQYSYGGIKAPM